MPSHADDWDEEHLDDFDEDDDTIPCPHCREPVYEDAERCPHCERYLSQEDAAGVRKPLWIIIGAAAALAVVYIWIAHNR
jgi:hypothetical protein